MYLLQFRNLSERALSEFNEIIVIVMEVCFNIFRIWGAISRTDPDTTHIFSVKPSKEGGVIRGIEIRRLKERQTDIFSTKFVHREMFYFVGQKFFVSKNEKRNPLSTVDSEA